MAPGPKFRPQLSYRSNQAADPRPLPIFLQASSSAAAARAAFLELPVVLYRNNLPMRRPSLSCKRGTLPITVAPTRR